MQVTCTMIYAPKYDNVGLYIVRGKYNNVVVIDTLIIYTSLISYYCYNIKFEHSTMFLDFTRFSPTCFKS